MIEFVVEMIAVAQRNMPALLVLIGIIIGLLLILNWRKVDQAVKAFRRAGLRVNSDTVQRLREDFAKVASEHERQRVIEENKQRQELMVIQRERERILTAVQSAPAVVKEAGKALQAIEKEYEASLGMVKSEQAREALRLATEKQINDVLRSVNVPAAKLPQFKLPATDADIEGSDLTKSEAAQELMASDQTPQLDF